MTEGVVYIASGTEYIEQAKISAESLKEHTDYPVTLVCDRSVSECYFDSVISKPDFDYHYGDSVLKIPELPYDKTLLLDTDTVVCGDVSDIFSVVDGFDIAASTIADNEFTLSDTVPTSFPEYNTGVVAFSKETTESFISDWKSRYEKHLQDGIRMNQPSFREALYQSELRIATLPTEYNCRVNFGGYLTDIVRIIHGRIQNPDDIIAELNKTNQPRIFYSTESGLVVRKVNVSNQKLSSICE